MGKLDGMTSDQLKGQRGFHYIAWTVGSARWMGEAWRWICILNNGGGWWSVRDRVRVADDLKGSLEILIQGVASQ